MQPTSNVDNKEDIEIVAAQKSFNPFRIFDRSVARKFLVRPRDHDKYTEDQLEELVPHNLRVFVFDGEVWYLAKDVCSFLGITPDHTSRSLKSIDQACIRQEQISLAPPSGAQVNDQRRSFCLLSEAGIYALIQKSKTQYAIEFKEWLNEEVLPEIRRTGGYQMSKYADKERDVIHDHLEFQVEVAKSKTEEELKEEYEDILKEKDAIIEEKECIIEVQKGTIEQQQKCIEIKNKEHTELMDYLKGITCMLETNAESSRKQIESLKKESKKQIESLKEENREQAQKAQEQMEALTEESKSLRTDFKKLQDKMDVVIKDRVAKPADEGKLQIFAIFETGEEDIEEKRFPYVICKCQKQNLKTNKKRIKDKYEDARKVFSIENPSAESLFQVLKEKVKKDGLGIRFNNTGFYFTDDELGLADVVRLVQEIDRERVNVD